MPFGEKTLKEAIDPCAGLLGPRSHRIIGLGLKSTSSTNGVSHARQGKLTSFEGCLIVLAQDCAKHFLDLGAPGKNRSRNYVSMVEIEPQFETGIADGNFKTRLPRRSKGVQRRLQVRVAHVMIRVEKHPEFVAELDFFVLTDTPEGMLQPLDHVLGRGESGVCRCVLYDDPHPRQGWMLEILRRGIRVIRGHYEYPVVAQRTLCPSDGERLSVEETHGIKSGWGVPLGFSSSMMWRTQSGISDSMGGTASKRPSR